MTTSIPNPDVNERIQMLRKAVADGSYEVSAFDLADKLIDSMLDRR